MLVTIINSRRAKEHLEKIKREHAELLARMEEHRSRVSHEKRQEEQQRLSREHELAMKQQEIASKYHA